MIIAIDGGTTNTRLTLIDAGKVLDRVKRTVGARDTVNGTNALSEAVKSGLDELSTRYPEPIRHVRTLALSGMIGSETGLHAVGHLIAPAGLSELRAGVETVSIPEISSLPFCFIPGVKTVNTASTVDLSRLDVMRGEETEIIGILSALGLSGQACTAIMPGSHMKVVSIDSSGRIDRFRTSLSGELMRAAAENTILSRSLGKVYPKQADADYLSSGFAYAVEHGINEALFKVRILANFYGTEPEKLYSFLMGAILRDDILSILSAPAKGPLIVAGSDPLRSAIAALLQKEREVTVLPDQLAEECSAVGAEIITCG